MHEILLWGVRHFRGLSRTLAGDHRMGSDHFHCTLKGDGVGRASRTVWQLLGIHLIGE